MTNIDVPNFDEALQADHDGSFHRSAQDHLAEAAATLRGEIQSGLAPLDYERALKIENALQKATEIVRFSAAFPRTN